MSIVFYYTPRSSATRVMWALEEVIIRLMRNTSDRWPVEMRNGAVAELTGKDLHGTMVAYAGQIGVDLSQYRNVAAWIGRIVARPAFGRALAG